MYVSEHFIKVQILEYPVNRISDLSEWVPFTVENIKKQEEPLSWRDPVQIFDSTKYTYPNEILSVERLYNLNHTDAFLHVALQFRSKSVFSWLQVRILEKLSNGLQPFL